MSEVTSDKVLQILLMRFLLGVLCSVDDIILHKSTFIPGSPWIDYLRKHYICFIFVY